MFPMVLQKYSIQSKADSSSQDDAFPHCEIQLLPLIRPKKNNY